jgi:hypothetical protein
MTPDELPADMEGLIENVALPWIEAKETFADPEDLTKAGQAIRALLKAYQEQRRALEEAAKYLCRLEGALLADDLDMRLNFPGEPSPTAMAERILPGFDSIEYDLTRAALNQKSDER